MERLDHVIGLKTPEQLVNGPGGVIDHLTVALICSNK